ncbi:hypothetical protein KFK09_006326 [Dendrobium nobile]|uniref:Uncharacterized protein n=1 Tax=Dendrobium nobile TaxID=94219 RepID=A0A8T3BRC1_DENNO|nr:hypothetical protein KFK09_006326 [Dendrobium nobile]
MDICILRNPTTDCSCCTIEDDDYPNILLMFLHCLKLIGWKDMILKLAFAICKTDHLWGIQSILCYLVVFVLI